MAGLRGGSAPSGNDDTNNWGRGNVPVIAINKQSKRAEFRRADNNPNEHNQSEHGRRNG